VFGASGSGTSTLARGLASRMAMQAFDTDDFYWHPTDPPFREKRRVPDRVRLMEEMFLPRANWVLSGSCDGWGDVVIPRLTHAVFLTLPAGQRLARLRARERRRYGKEIEPGGRQFEAYRGFLNYSMSYEDGDVTMRSLQRHEAWIAGLPCPVLRLDARTPLDELVRDTMQALDPGAASS